MTEVQDHLTSAMSTLQHIEKLHLRAQQLEALRVEAEEQLLHRIGNAYASGNLTAEALSEVYDRYSALRIPGRTLRWNEAVPILWIRMPRLPKWQPNGPAGTWIGPWPLGDDDALPMPGSCVVYILFDAFNEPIYVGSTGDFRIRLKAHAKQKKPFVRWQAYVTDDREAAYRLEVKLLKEHLPRLNKRVGR